MSLDRREASGRADEQRAGVDAERAPHRLPACASRARAGGRCRCESCVERRRRGNPDRPSAAAECLDTATIRSAKHRSIALSSASCTRTSRGSSRASVRPGHARFESRAARRPASRRASRARCPCGRCVWTMSTSCARRNRARPRTMPQRRCGAARRRSPVSTPSRRSSRGEPAVVEQDRGQRDVRLAGEVRRRRRHLDFRARPQIGGHDHDRRAAGAAGAWLDRSTGSGRPPSRRRRGVVGDRAVRRRRPDRQTADARAPRVVAQLVSERAAVASALMTS